MIAFVRGRDRRAREIDVDERVVLAHVHENRLRPRHDDGLDRRDEGIGNRDNLVARPDAVGSEREMERGGAGMHADAMRGLAVSREIRFERLELRPENERGAVDDVPDRFVDLFSDFSGARLEVNERDLLAHDAQPRLTLRPSGKIISCLAALCHPIFAARRYLSKYLSNFRPDSPRFSLSRLLKNIIITQ